MSLVAVDWKPDRRKLRGFGIICTVFFGAVACWISLRHSFLFFDFSEPSARTAALVLAVVSGVCALSSLVFPRAIYPLYVTLTAISLPIGFVLSHIVMGLLYYVVLSPVALVFRLIGRDALDRKIDRGAKSYWTSRSQVTDRERYFRQY